MKPELLVTVQIEDERLAPFRDLFTVHHSAWPDLETIRNLGRNARAVLTNGTVGLSAAAMDAMPQLRIVAAQGAGTENIDIAAANERGIVVTNGAGTNADCVADHAIALLLSVVRSIPIVDRLARTGEWTSLRINPPALYSKALGIVGFGRVGQLIAKRSMGFDMSVAYHSRRPVPDISLPHVPDIVRLAEMVDFLILACPGGAATRHLVSQSVLEALGPSGFLVNVARGSVVDTAALIDALRSGRLGGAALDVFENEPGVPRELWDVPRLVVTTHLAGSAPEVRDQQIAVALRNYRKFLAGEALVNIVTAP